MVQLRLKEILDHHSGFDKGFLYQNFFITLMITISSYPQNAGFEFEHQKGVNFSIGVSVPKINLLSGTLSYKLNSDYSM